MTTLRLRRSLGWATTVLLAASAAWGQGGEQKAMSLIVKVTGERGGKVVTWGGGIVVAATRDAVDVVTAGHVLHKDLGVIGGHAEEVRWRVRFKSGATFEPKLLEEWKELDLALLRVHPLSGDLPSDALPDPASVRFVPTSLVKRGDGTYPVGHPQGREWYVPSQPVPVHGVSGDGKIEIDFENCVPGISGGGLFDDRWRPLGLVVKSDLTCVAIGFEKIHTALRKRGYRVDLCEDPSPPFSCSNPSAVWPEDYDEAIDVLKVFLDRRDVADREWQDLIGRLKMAACAATQSITYRKLDGGRSEPRLPHYYLGLAHYQSNDLGQALTQWSESDRRGFFGDKVREREAVPTLIAIARAGLAIECSCDNAGRPLPPGYGEARAEVGEVLRSFRLKKRGFKRLGKIRRELETLRADLTSAAEVEDRRQ